MVGVLGAHQRREFRLPGSNSRHSKEYYVATFFAMALFSLSMTRFAHS